MKKTAVVITYLEDDRQSRRYFDNEAAAEHYADALREAHLNRAVPNAVAIDVIPA